MVKAQTDIENKGCNEISTDAGSKRLRELEAAIKKGYAEFWLVGQALAEIKTNKLYKAPYSKKDYKNFKEYVEEKWGYRSRAYQLMLASKVRMKLIEAGIKKPETVVKSEQDFRKIDSVLNLDEGMFENFKGQVSKADVELSDIRSALGLPEPEEKKPMKPPKDETEALTRLQLRMKGMFEKLKQKYSFTTTYKDWTSNLPC